MRKMVNVDTLWGDKISEHGANTNDPGSKISPANIVSEFFLIKSWLAVEYQTVTEQTQVDCQYASVQLSSRSHPKAADP